jgi:hypothetical protein
MKTGLLRTTTVSPNISIMLDHEQALMQELLQPLTVLVARAEVIGDLARSGPKLDLMQQIAALSECARRVAQQADDVHRALYKKDRSTRAEGHTVTRADG